MLELKIDTSEAGAYFECPLRTDRRCCGALAESPVNHCPQHVEDENYCMQALPPDDCPLRDGGVLIQFKEEEEA